MKKIRPIALYALVTAAMTLGAGSVLAQHGTGQDVDTDPKSTQRDHDAMRSSDMTMSRTDPMSGTGAAPVTSNKPDAKSMPNDHSAQRAKDAVAQTPAADRANKSDNVRMQNRGYMDSAPVNGMQASDLIGAEVKTTGGENVGPVDDLIIDENGQIVAIVIGVGGFLNMGEKDVAIGWDDVTRSGDSDDQELRIDMTRDDLRPAPEYAKRD